MDREELRNALLDLVEQETWDRPESLDDSVNLREGLKLDSVDLLSVSLRAEEQFGISLGSNDFVGLVTVGDLLDRMLAKMAAKGKNKAA